MAIQLKQMCLNYRRTAGDRSGHMVYGKVFFENSKVYSYSGCVSQTLKVGSRVNTHSVSMNAATLISNASIKYLPSNYPWFECLYLFIRKLNPPDPSIALQDYGRVNTTCHSHGDVECSWYSDMEYFKHLPKSLITSWISM